MWVPIVLAAATLGLFGVPRREFFEGVKDPSTLTDEEFQALLDSEQGRAVKTELIASLRRQGVPDTAIPELVTRTVKDMLVQSWGMYSSLTDKTNLEGRFDQMFLSESFIGQNGKPLAQAYASFFKMYYIPASATASGPEVQARVGEIVELAKEAGPNTAVSPLNVLIQSVKDDDVRNMLKNYATHMVTYYTTGETAYKVAAQRSLDAVEAHVKKLQDKVEEETTRATKMVNEYDTSNEDVTKLRKQLRSIRKEGPKLEDQYETQKRINDNQPVIETKYWVKIGIVVGLFAIAFVSRSFVSENAPPGPRANYILKFGLIAGLAVVGFAAYRFLLG